MTEKSERQFFLIAQTHLRQFSVQQSLLILMFSSDLSREGLKLGGERDRQMNQGRGEHLCVGGGEGVRSLVTGVTPNCKMIRTQ